MTQPIPDGLYTLTPHITVKNASEAIEFYKRAFGAEETMRNEMAGLVAHAQLRIGDSVLMVNDEFPDLGAKAPTAEGSGVVLHLYVEDVDAWFQRAIDAGGESQMPVQDTFWGDRYGMLKDPYGHRWSIATHKEDLTPAEIAQRAEKMFAG